MGNFLEKVFQIDAPIPETKAATKYQNLSLLKSNVYIKLNPNNDKNNDKIFVLFIFSLKISVRLNIHQQSSQQKI